MFLLKLLCCFCVEVLYLYLIALVEKMYDQKLTRKTTLKCGHNTCAYLQGKKTLPYRDMVINQFFGQNSEIYVNYKKGFINHFYKCI